MVEFMVNLILIQWNIRLIYNIFILKSVTVCYR